MEEDLSEVIPCSSLTVDSILRVGAAGAIWGTCVGPYDARRFGLKGIAYSSFVGKTTAKFGFQCGLVAGIFTSTRCLIQRYRNQNDWVNALIAGAVAGGALAAGTRNWTHVISTAGLVSVFSAAADYSKTL
ncbi:hypothetical protein K2173_026196 [Erythroxylum novogranatense]|uniref:Uncharacterized protein n=1 Tax=Erythroxylum novogranatense TaxID=1862640 RepID=A0AAV8SBG2_9ROSI|nr:hypothetical protein K2173_026196 [Erythroxylum novogranatense]